VRGLRHPRDAHVIEDRTEAIQFALEQARPEDCLLIAGKGHERYQIVNGKRIPLNDAEIARDWLYDVQPFAQLGN